MAGSDALPRSENCVCEGLGAAEDREFEAVEVVPRLRTRICFSRDRISAQTSSSAVSRFCTVSSIDESKTF